MNPPLVSVICLCHNQAPYVEGALMSVLKQTYSNIELIVVDDASTDGSQGVIRHFLEHYSGIQFIELDKNVGNCTAFNIGWRASKGQFVIDLAADDVLLPQRVEIGIVKFQEDQKVGVHFTDALLIDADGNSINRHNERFSTPIPEGDIYAELVRRYLICPPTMMFRREVIETLDGYDESLAFEDFDFWVRSARDFKYAFTDEVLVEKRILENSLSSKQWQFMNDHQRSTLAVCEKILRMNRSKNEGQALKSRCWYEIRQCIKKGNLGLIPNYLSIIRQS